MYAHPWAGEDGAMRSRLIVLLLLTALPAAALVVPGASARGGHNVALRDNRFAPRSITIGRGSRVEWHWRGHHRHNVTGNGFASSTKKRGSFSHVFRRRGTYRVFCSIHANMRMTIRVR